MRQLLAGGGDLSGLNEARFHPALQSARAFIRCQSDIEDALAFHAAAVRSNQPVLLIVVPLGRHLVVRDVGEDRPRSEHLLARAAIVATRSDPKALTVLVEMRLRLFEFFQPLGPRKDAAAIEAAAAGKKLRDITEGFVVFV